MAKIRAALLEIIGLASPATRAGQATSSSPARPTAPSPRLTGGARGTPTKHDQPDQLRESVSSRSAKRPTPLSKAGETFLNHFCELVFSAVHKMVLRSHDQFCRSLWAGHPFPGQTRAVEEETGSNDAEPRSSPSDSKPLQEQKKKKTVSFTEPLSTSAAPPRCRPDQTFHRYPPPPRPARPLRLEVNALFSIPRIHLEPTLSHVHSFLDGVSAALLAVVQQLTWWVGPQAGRTLFQVLRLGSVVQARQDGVMQAVMCKSGINCCRAS